MASNITGTRTSEEVESFKHKQHALMQATPAEIETYVLNNTGSTAEIRAMFILTLKLIKANMK